jgi:hypothetical protein
MALSPHDPKKPSRAIRDKLRGKFAEIIAGTKDGSQQKVRNRH